MLPQFANQSAGHVPLQLLLLSLVSLPIGLISDGSWGLAASDVRAWFARSPLGWNWSTASAGSP